MTILLHPKTIKQEQLIIEIMNTFSLKNFRSFGKEGATFQIAPITILTGCNSAGKSSMVKAKILLEEMLKKLDGKFTKLADAELDFANTNAKFGLGKFSKVINKNAGENGEIELSYSYDSVWTAQKMTVKMIFERWKNDIFDNGHLKSYSLYDANGDCIVRYKVAWGCNENGEFHFLEPEIVNFQLLNNSFYKWLLLECEKDKNAKIILAEHILNNREQAKELIEVGEKKENFEKDLLLIKGCLNQLNVSDDERRIYNKYCNGSFEKIKTDTLTNCFRTRTIFYNPLLDIIGSMNKVEMRDWFEKHVDLTNEDKDAEILSILEEFEASDFNSFIEYYRSLEEDFYKYEVANFSSPDSLWMDTELAIYHFGRQKIFALYKIAKKQHPDFIFDNNIIFAYFHFFGSLLNESITMSIPVYVSSNRVAAKRLYTLDQSDDEFSNLLRNYRRYMQTSQTNIPTFVNRWLKEFGIGDSLIIESTPEGYGITLKIKKGDEEVLLADEGYGITQLVSLLLNIQMKIFPSPFDMYSDEADITDYNQHNDHYGILHGVRGFISIEEPEIHLHPAMQSKLADMFLEAYQKHHIGFIIETHSEYLIRESQVLVSKMGYKTNVESDRDCPFRTYYVPTNGQPYSLGYRKDGRFAERFGDGFYNESANLTNKML